MPGTALRERTVALGRSGAGAALPALVHRLGSPVRESSRLWGWLGPLGVSLVAAVFRLWRLGEPRIVLFDETYYAKDAWSLLQYGYVREFTDSANDKIVAGRLSGIFKPEVTQIVHPDGGKWLIAAGEHFFGLTPFGWRVSAAIFGTLTVLVLCRLVRRMTGSTLLGCAAGLLLATDGLHLVVSRLALLDVFVGFWVVCAVACLVADRDWARARFARAAATRVSRWGPIGLLLLRPWRIAAGACFGAACGTKWSGVYALAAFSLLSWMWDARARRALGVRAAWLRSAVVDGLPAFVSLVGVALAVYLTTWVGFFRHRSVYEDRFGHGYGDEAAWGAYLNSPATSWPGTWFDALRSLWHYHAMAYRFHTGDYLAAQTHPYRSDPQGWPLLNRPVGIDAQLDLPPSTPGCAAAADDTCLRQVLALGNPVLWWLGAIALAVCLVLLVVRRDWRFCVPLIGVGANWLPWLRFDDRPIFLFYAAAFIPFTAMAVALVLGWLMGPPGAGLRRRMGVGTLLAVLGLQLAAFAFFWPIWTDELITRAEWLDRMWFDAWI